MSQLWWTPMSLTRMASSGKTLSISCAARCGWIGEASSSEARRDVCVPLAAMPIDGGQLFRARGGRIANAITAIELRQHLLEKGTHVGHQPERDRIIAGDLVGIDVDVDELGRWNGE